MTAPERIASGEKDACLARSGGEGRSSLCCDDIMPSGSSGSAGNHPSPAAQGEPTAIMTFSTQCSESRCGGARCAPPAASPCGLRRRCGAKSAWERTDWSVSLLLSQPLNRPLLVIGKLTDPLRNRTPPLAAATSLATRAGSGEPPEATGLASRESSEPGGWLAWAEPPPALPHATLHATAGAAPARVAVLALPTPLRRSVAFTPGSRPLLRCPVPQSCASCCASSRSSCRIRCLAESRGRSFIFGLSSANMLPLLARARAPSRPTAGEPLSESALQVCCRPAAGSHAAWPSCSGTLSLRAVDFVSLTNHARPTSTNAEVDTEAQMENLDHVRTTTATWKKKRPA
eukprot:scaffold64459_cov58-Phaeocystis_antarctica.AAC.4